MTKFEDGCLAIAAYFSSVAGEPTKSLDFRVRWFAETDPEQVRRLLENEPPHEYLNDVQQTVRMELAEIFQIDRVIPFQSGDEIVGFIAGIDELSDLVQSQE